MDSLHRAYVEPPPSRQVGRGLGSNPDLQFWNRSPYLPEGQRIRIEFLEEDGTKNSVNMHLPSPEVAEEMAFARHEVTSFQVIVHHDNETTFGPKTHVGTVIDIAAASENDRGNRVLSRLAKAGHQYVVVHRHSVKKGIVNYSAFERGEHVIDPLRKENPAVAHPLDVREPSIPGAYLMLFKVDRNGKKVRDFLPLPSGEDAAHHAFAQARDPETGVLGYCVLEIMAGSKKKLEPVTWFGHVISPQQEFSTGVKTSDIASFVQEGVALAVRRTLFGKEHFTKINANRGERVMGLNGQLATLDV
jgi:hypothetical protein